jgi:hypothetical protein
MQKVVGSNPISRFFANALHVAVWSRHGIPETKWNHPHIASILDTSSQNGADVQRLAAISGDSASLFASGGATGPGKIAPGAPTLVIVARQSTKDPCNVPLHCSCGRTTDFI